MWPHSSSQPDACFIPKGVVFLGGVRGVQLGTVVTYKKGKVDTEQACFPRVRSGAFSNLAELEANGLLVLPSTHGLIGYKPALMRYHRRTLPWGGDDPSTELM